MKIHRCPWCGIEIVKEKKEIYKNAFKAELCPDCNRYYQKSGIVLTAAFSLAAFFLSFGIWGFWGFLIGPLLLILIFIFAVPAAPYQKDQSEAEFEEENYQANAKIDWYPQSLGGIKAPFLALQNGEIFPICFVDSNDRPVSEMLCAAFTKMKWNSGEFSANITLLSSEKEDFLSQSGAPFYVFYQRRKIGAGVITSYKKTQKGQNRTSSSD